MIRWILLVLKTSPKRRFFRCLFGSDLPPIGAPFMRVLNLIKSAYKDTARMAKIINLPNMIIVLRVVDDLLIAWLYGNPYDDPKCQSLISIKQPTLLRRLLKQL